MPFKVLITEVSTKYKKNGHLGQQMSVNSLKLGRKAGINGFSLMKGVLNCHRTCRIPNDKDRQKVLVLKV